MQDQANALRDLIRESGKSPNCDLTHRARRLVVTGGKSGEGKTNLALNLAICLQERGRNVVLVEPGGGSGKAGALCHLDRRYNLSHVFSGERTLSEVVVPGPAGIRVLSGTGVEEPPTAASTLLNGLNGLEDAPEDVVVDAGKGLNQYASEFLTAADVPLLVTTPKPTAITDAYALVKTLSTTGPSIPWKLIVNQASSPAEAHQVFDRIDTACQRFLGTSVPPAGYVLADPHVSAAVRRRRPWVLEYPACPASRCLGRLADWLVSEASPVSLSTRKRIESPPRFFTRMENRGRRVTAS